MPRSLAVAIAALALAACQSTVYYAEGVTVAARESDLGQCRSEARRDFPPRLETRYTPHVFRPAVQTCDADGSCTVTPPYWDGGAPYTVDRNEPARRQAVVACMGRLGYTQVRLPRCRGDQTVTPSTIMAPLQSDTCLIRTSDSSLVVNP